MENAERFAELCEKDIPIMAEVFRSAFGHEPWNEDWSDDERLKAYLGETVCAVNSLCYGLFVNGKLAAVSIGIKNELRHRRILRLPRSAGNRRRFPLYRNDR